MFQPLLDAGIAVVFPLFFVLAIGGPLLLWWLIDTESDGEESEHRDWSSAERAARRDTRDRR
ncbi:hypothetical protein ZOD2009_22352 [Haladaptatus paucihalophilus DX253]|uniref:Uncharacterized protein n=1 Tax=Haladaptatus paucihalophilus DX253 TaxID=797209 RepID=E7R076_HALPU|nr:MULTISPECIES: hypothetical protein [Haladaptatus]EFW89970.1 hypothetical protein ZOD2009_22352 [Haladaptatus paucihalophilus DX253]GKZ12982.1 hypothetical protein HAL_08630 [Haladaptatus sp. T7]SHK59693.1 hypothetical protein SAMN05444342_1800 [Haladaptatus paucihalophilus DX253]